MTRPTISLQAAIGPGVAGNPFIIGSSLIGGPDLIAGTEIVGQGSWAEIGDRAVNVSIRSGRQRRLEQYRASTLVAELGNEDGALDPSWTAGPYTTGGVTQINTNVGVKAVATWQGVDYPLYYGFADGWHPIRTYPEGGMMGLAATDAFKIFQRIDQTVGAVTGASETTAQRLTRYLDSINWSTALRNIGTDTRTHQAIASGGNLAAQMRLAADSARGDLYVAPDGKVTFVDRYLWYLNPRALTVQWTFGDGDTEISPAGFEEARDDQTVYNDVNVSRIGGATITRRDPTVAAYPYLWSSYNRSDLTLEDDGQVASYAEQVLRTSKDGGSRVDSITLEPDGFDDLWPVVLAARFGDRISCNLTHPFTGVRFVGDYFIEGKDTDIPVLESGGKWVTTLYLSSAAAYPTHPFIIGSSLIGGADVII